MSATVNDWEQLLLKTLVPNTEILQASTKQLNRLLKAPSCVAPLFQVIVESQQAAVRQSAAVFLRKKIVTHWRKLDDPVKLTILNTLPSLLIREPKGPTQTAIKNLMSYLARLTVPLGQWKELLVFLFQSSQSPNPEHREIAMKLFYSLTETIGETLKAHHETLFKLFLNGLQDQEYSVRFASLRCTGVFFEWLDDKELGMVSQLLPHMLQVMKIGLENGHENDILNSLEIFDRLVEENVPQIKSLLPAISQFLLAISREKKFSYSLREKAISFFEAFAAHQPKLLLRQKLLEPVVSTLLELIVEAESSPFLDSNNTNNNTNNNDDEDEELDDEDDEDDNRAEDEDGGSETAVAAGVLERLATSLAPRKLFPLLLSALQILFNSSSTTTTTSSSSSSSSSFDSTTSEGKKKGKREVSVEERQRRAGLLVLGVLAEGCPEGTLSHLKLLLPLVVDSLGHPLPAVRHRAVLALALFARNLQPELSEEVATLLPRTVALLDDPNTKVRLKACYALECLLEPLEPKQVRPYVEALMHKLVPILDRDGKERDIAITAIGALATAAKQDFVNYAGAVLQRLQHYLQVPSDSSSSSSSSSPSPSPVFSVETKCRAIETAGVVASALGKETFCAAGGLGETYVATFVPLAFHCLEFGDFQLNEEVFHFFASVAELLGEKFSGLLNAAVGPVLASCLSDEGIVPDTSPDDDEENNNNNNNNTTEEGEEVDAEDAAEAAVADAEEGEDNEDEKEEEEGLGVVNMKVHTSFLEEKAVAAQALGSFAKATTSHFQPYLDKSIETLELLSSHFHDEVRHAAVVSLQHMLRVVAASNGLPEWKKGVPFTLPLPVQTYFDKIMIILVPRFGDEDQGTVEGTFEAITGIIDIVGPAIQTYSAKIVHELGVVLDKKALCQHSEDDDLSSTEDEEDDNEHEGGLFNSVTECAVALAKAFGLFAEPLLRPLFSKLARYCSSSSSTSSASTGSSSSSAAKRATLVYATSPLLRSIALGTVGELARELEGAMVPHFGLFLQSLREALDPSLDSAAEAGGGVSSELAQAVVRRNASYALAFLLSQQPANTRELEEGWKLFATLLQTEKDAAVLDNLCGGLARLALVYLRHHQQQQQQVVSTTVQALLAKLPLREDLEPYEVIAEFFLALLASAEARPSMQTIAVPLINLFGKALTEKNELTENGKELLISLIQQLSAAFSIVVPQLQ